MIFDSPQWLLALLALPLIAGAEVWLTGRDRDRLARLVARPLWGRVVRRPDERWRWVRLARNTLYGTGSALLTATLFTDLILSGATAVEWGYLFLTGPLYPLSHLNATAGVVIKEAIPPFSAFYRVFLCDFG